MIRGFKGKAPRIAESAFISEAAHIIGDVEIGERSSVWPRAVIRGDLGKGQIEAGMKIGHNTHVEDNAVVHGTETIGNNVVIGHGAVVEATKVGDNVLIGNNATLMATSEVGSFCIVASGAVVLPGVTIPDRSFVAGAPAVVKGEISAEQIEHMEIAHSVMSTVAEEYKKD